MPSRRTATLLLAGVALLPLARAETAPDALVEQVSTEVIRAIAADEAMQAGDTERIRALVDAKVMPHVNFRRMTASAVGRYWRRTSADQQAAPSC